MKRMRKLQHELLQESIKGDELPKILWEIFGVLVKSVQSSVHWMSMKWEVKKEGDLDMTNSEVASEEEGNYLPK